MNRKHLAAVDPGKLSELAYFCDDELHQVVGYQVPIVVPADCHLRVEYPDRIDFDIQTVLDLAGIAGAWELMNCGHSSRVKPSAWNKSRKKPINHRIGWEALTSAERVIAARAIGHSEKYIRTKIENTCERYAKTNKITGYDWKAHNKLDAICIGLHALGRFR